MASFFKGKHSKTGSSAAREPPRGELNEDEKVKVLKYTRFTELKGKEQEAFLKFLRGNKYPETEDVCAVDPKELKGTARKYQFWVKCERSELLQILQEFVTTEDVDRRLLEVGKVLAAEDDKDKVLDEKLESARSVEEFINKLKDEMKQELDTKFTAFQKQLS